MIKEKSDSLVHSIYFWAGVKQIFCFWVRALWLFLSDGPRRFLRKEPDSGKEAGSCDFFYFLVGLDREVFEPEVVHHVVEYPVELVTALEVGDFCNGVVELNNHDFVCAIDGVTNFVEPDGW